QLVNLIQEYVDIFALSLLEVQPVDFIWHALNVPSNLRGPRWSNQKPLSEPQLEWLYKTLDDMEGAGIVKKI
ncbi:hypothetical protein K439DRAFT_1276497, partial [Ramaria rubella]